MDVTCERCGTEYEFDETLVSDRGTTVKCTNCGHLFKVFRPDTDGSGAKTWSVRTADGHTRTLSSLKELQRLIGDNVLDEDDLISRGDEDWKRLGDIAELSTFFAAAAAGSADTEIDAARPPGRSRRATKPDVSAGQSRHVRAMAQTDAADRTDLDPPDVQRGVPERPQKSTIIGIGAVTTSEPPPRPRAPRPPSPPRRPGPDVRPGPNTRPAGEMAAPPMRPDAAGTAQARPAPRPAPRPPTQPRAAAPAPPSYPPPPESYPPPMDSTPTPAPESYSPPPSARTPERALYLDDLEPVAPARGRSRSGLWVGLVVLLTAAVGVALGWPQIAPLLGLAEAAEDPADPHADAGEQALALDTMDGYQQAVHEYTQALAFDDHSVRVLTGLSRAHATWAQALAFDADDLEARADADPTRLGQANAVRGEQHRHAEMALLRAEAAVRHGAGDVGAEVALADSLRLTNDLTRARSRLERALTLESEPSAETLRVQALIEAAEADGDLTRAREEAEAAVAEDPAMIRARLLYARALLSARDVSGARAQIDAVLRRAARHPRAIALRDAIDEGLPPAPPTVDVPDAGIVAADPDGVAPAAPPAAAAPPAGNRTGDDEPRARPTASDDEGVPAGRDYSYYIRRADDALERGNIAEARALYEAASAQRSSGSEALTGLGYCALEGGDASGAAGRFRQAAGQGYAEAYIGLGAAYRRMGRDRDALTAYERYLVRLPSGPRASIARRQVEELAAVLRAEPAGGGSAPDAPPASPEGASPGPSADDAPPPTPPNQDGTLPPPRDMDTPPPADVPALD